MIDGLDEVGDTKFFLFQFGLFIRRMDIITYTAYAQGIDAQLIQGAFHVAGNIVGIRRWFADRQVAGKFQFADFILAEKTEFAFCLACHDTVEVSNAQDLAHVTAIGFVGADRIDLVEAAENTTDIGVLDLAHQQVR